MEHAATAPYKAKCEPGPSSWQAPFCATAHVSSHIIGGGEGGGGEGGGGKGGGGEGGGGEGGDGSGAPPGGYGGGDGGDGGGERG